MSYKVVTLWNGKNGGNDDDDDDDDKRQHNISVSVSAGKQLCAVL